MTIASGIRAAQGFVPASLNPIASGMVRHNAVVAQEMSFSDVLQGAV